VAEGSNNKIEKKVWIQASAATIFQALTEAKALEKWFCDKASCEPREGGELSARWDFWKPPNKGRARFTRIVPDLALELQWIDDGGNAESSHTLSYEIIARSGMTELVMIDKDIMPLDEETFAFIDQGWNSVLRELKDYCEYKERATRKGNV